MTSDYTAFVGIGSNGVDPPGAVVHAVSALSVFSPVISISQVYETIPMGAGKQPSYLNCVARLRWRGSPRSLLCTLQQIEARLGRTRTVRWGPRSVDLDLLLFSDFVRNDMSLQLPHPYIDRRVFVLLPLLELEPGLRSPRTGVPYRHYMIRLPAAGWNVVFAPPRCRRGFWVMKAA